MKQGDLVEWKPNFFDTNGDLYVNPGLILSETKMVNNTRKYVIMWADGRITVEYGGYLEWLQKSKSET